MLYKIGHLDLLSRVSMINVYISSFNASYNSCIIIGCASNFVTIISGNVDLVMDFGIVRTAFFFGPIWIIIYIILVLNESKSKLLPICYFISMLHYPVVFGIKYLMKDSHPRKYENFVYYSD